MTSRTIGTRTRNRRNPTIAIKIALFLTWLHDSWNLVQKLGWTITSGFITRPPGIRPHQKQARILMSFRCYLRRFLSFEVTLYKGFKTPNSSSLARLDANFPLRDDRPLWKQDRSIHFKPIAPASEHSVLFRSLSVIGVTPKCESSWASAILNVC